MKLLNGALGWDISVLSYDFAPKAFRRKIFCLSDLYFLFIQKYLRPFFTVPSKDSTYFLSD